MWRDMLPSAETLARRAANAVLQRAYLEKAAAEISIVLSDDEFVRDLNGRYRNQDKATNVLSFPAEDQSVPGLPRLLGDVILAYDTIAREAREQETPFADHFQHLCVHGVLHLLGHDHQTNAEAAMMENLEVSILASLGIENPYGPPCSAMKSTA